MIILYQFSLPGQYISLQEGWENVRFELASETGLNHLQFYRVVQRVSVGVITCRETRSRKPQRSRTGPSVDFQLQSEVVWIHRRAEVENVFTQNEFYEEARFPGKVEFNTTLVLVHNYASIRFDSMQIDLIYF